MIVNLYAGKKIAEQRGVIGLTQQAMADRLGMSLRQYNKYENGSFPKFKSTSIQQIDEILGTDIQALLYEQNSPNKLRKTAVTTVETNIEKALSDHEERLLRAESMLEVYEIALAELLSEKKGDFTRKVGELRDEVKKVANRRFDELSRKRG